MLPSFSFSFNFSSISVKCWLSDVAGVGCGAFPLHGFKGHVNAKLQVFLIRRKQQWRKRIWHLSCLFQFRSGEKQLL